MKEWVKAILFSRWAYTLVRLGYGLLFIYAGANKLTDTRSFAVVIEAFGLVPDGWIMTIAIGLPALEITAGLGLLFDIRWSLGLVSGLLFCFTAIVSYGIWLGLDIDCGCFGPQDPEAGAYGGLRPSLYRNLVMTVGIIYMYLWRLGRPGAGMKPFFRKLLYHEEG